MAAHNDTDLRNIPFAQLTRMRNRARGGRRAMLSAELDRRSQVSRARAAKAWKLTPQERRALVDALASVYQSYGSITYSSVVSAAKSRDMCPGGSPSDRQVKLLANAAKKRHLELQEMFRRNACDFADAIQSC